MSLTVAPITLCTGSNNPSRIMRVIHVRLISGSSPFCLVLQSRITLLEKYASLALRALPGGISRSLLIATSRLQRNRGQALVQFVKLLGGQGSVEQTIQVFFPNGIFDGVIKIR